MTTTRETEPPYERPPLSKEYLRGEAERADARHSISPAQVTGLAAAHEMRRAEDRVEKWRTATDN